MAGFGGIVDWLSGASGNADKIGSYYSGAANKASDAYGAEKQWALDQYANEWGPISGLYQTEQDQLPGLTATAAGNVGAGYTDAATKANAAYDASGAKIGGYYDAAGKALIDGTTGVGKTFTDLTSKGLQPQFDEQNNALAAKLAAMGITGSGAGKADFSDLASRQSSTLAGAVAPIYQNAASQYGQLLGQGAGAQAGNAGSQAGAVSNIVGAGAGANAAVYGAGQAAQNKAAADRAAALTSLGLGAAGTAGSLAGGSAGAQSSIAGSGAGAQANGYQQSISDFYAALQAAGQAVAGSPGGASTARSPQIVGSNTTFTGTDLPQVSAPGPDSFMAASPYTSAGGDLGSTGSGGSSLSIPATTRAPNWNPYQ